MQSSADPATLENCPWIAHPEGVLTFRFAAAAESRCDHSRFGAQGAARA